MSIIIVGVGQEDFKVEHGHDNDDEVGVDEGDDHDDHDGHSEGSDADGDEKFSEHGRTRVKLLLN